jgi:branched-chain amino acid transport system permease protein
LSISINSLFAFLRNRLKFSSPAFFHTSHAKIIGLLLLFAVPLVIRNPYVLHVFNLILYYIVLSVSLDLQVGMLGLLNFGQIGFTAIGAYTVAVLTLTVFHEWWGFWVAMLLGGGLAGLAGILVGLSTFKIRGDYFCIVSLGFGEVIRYIALNWVSVTHGPQGLTGIPAPKIFSWALSSRGDFYWFILVLALLTLLLTVRMKNSYLGRAWVAMREDELATEAMGVNLVKFKVMNITISAMIAGIAGGFFAGYLNYIAPTSFLSNESLNIMCMVILGGAGSIWGAVVGASILTLIPEILRPIADYRMLLFMIFRPKGVLGK